MHTVWPDVETKCSPSYSKSCPKSSLTSLTFHNCQKVTNHLGQFCNKIYCQEIPKIAQSGHTVNADHHHHHGTTRPMPDLIVIHSLQAVNSLFNELSSPEKREEDRCCPMQLKTGVQIIAGVLAIISSVILVSSVRTVVIILVSVLVSGLIRILACVLQ